MSADRLPFLKAVIAAPADDLPRLVFADWLDEHDDPRGEFVRLQIDRYRRGVFGIGPREYQLLLEHEPAWRAELPAGCRQVRFRRGFVDSLRCHARHLFDPDHPILAPVEHLTVEVSHLRAEWLAYSPPPLAVPVRELVVDCREPVGRELLTVLRRFGPFERLEALRLRDPMFGLFGAEALWPDATFPHLRVLDLSGCGVTDNGAEALAENGWAGRLAELVLHDNPISAGRRDWLRHRFGARLVI
jgi:uncharacterized protein (TIGR02996 family)